MIIHSMTATFGKLEHETLRFTPGLNVITAGNEWGKSTWCAFLTAMLYGVDSRAKTTKTNLADKDHYAPWSGEPMSGRMELNWQGREITIERAARGRQIFGEFRAFETETGLEIPELTGENCGQMLLGVEKSVFVRTAFLRLQDLPVGDDEQLRRRLNNLVTTGDESGSAEQLERGLKELKNRIRYNRTGRLPQLEEEQKQLERELAELQQLEESAGKLRSRIDEADAHRAALENHLAALHYEAAREDARKVDSARQLRDDAMSAWEMAQEECSNLPNRDTAVEMIGEIDRLRETRQAMEAQLQALEEPEPVKQSLAAFQNLEGEEACNQAGEDARHYAFLTKRRWLLTALGALLILGGAIWGVWQTIAGAVCASLGVVLLVCDWLLSRLRRKEAAELLKLYQQENPEDWERLARDYAGTLRRDRQARREYRSQRQSLEGQLRDLNESIRQSTQGRGLDECREDWEYVISAWERRTEAERDYRVAQDYLQTLRSMARTVECPGLPDTMTASEPETHRMLEQCREERGRLENLLGQYQGRIAALDSRDEIRKNLTEIRERMKKLERTYDALTLAQMTLSEAKAQLQRRFAPGISARTQALMGKLTGGRYDRVQLGEDLTLRAGAQREDILRDVLWRSEGTVDQLYFALRLAVAEELAPQAPLVLDDALVRFDDRRLKNALEVLKEQALHRQVILFSCQDREEKMV